jgi:hypothetical protein
VTDGWIRSKPNRTGAGLKASLNPIVGMILKVGSED